MHNNACPRGCNQWGKTNVFVTAGITGFNSESKGVTAKVYVKLMEEKLIPACRQMMDCRPIPLQDQRWVFQQDNAPITQLNRSKRGCTTSWISL
jgi:hypothetical protein